MKCNKPQCKFCQNREMKTKYIKVITVNDACCITFSKSTKKAPGEFHCSVCNVKASAATNQLGNIWSHCEGKAHFYVANSYSQRGPLAHSACACTATGSREATRTRERAV